jgi:AraC-like DNA-binding protein
VAGIVLGPPLRHITANGTVVTTETGFLIGPHDQPVTSEPDGETFCVGLIAAPAACQAVFGLRPSHLRGHVLDLATVWPASIALRGELLTLSTPDEMLDRVDATLASTIDFDVSRMARCERAAAVLTADPARSVAHVAAELDLSHAQFDDEFTRVVGLSPRTFARVARMRQTAAGQA